MWREEGRGGREGKGFSFLMNDNVLTPFSPLFPLFPPEQKWSKGKMREKVANKVLFDEETYNNRLLTEIPKSKLITPSSLVERLKINGSLARAALRELKEKGLIKPISVHHSQIIYTRAIAAAE